MTADAAHMLLLRLQTLVRAWGVLRAAFEHHEAQVEPELRVRTLPAVEVAWAGLRDEIRALTQNPTAGAVYDQDQPESRECRARRLPHRVG